MTPGSLQYQTRTYHVEVGTLTFDMEALIDFENTVDQMFAGHVALSPTDRVSEKDFLDRCPYFAALWPSARALGLVLSEMGETGLAGKRLLELGCGLALPGFVASRCGGTVTVSDFHPDVLRFLQKNIEINGMSGIRYREVDWNRNEALTVENDAESFDFIVGSDLLYDGLQPERLVTQIKKFAHPKSRVLIADPGRAYLQEFCNRMNDSGFKVSNEVAVAPAFYGKPAVEVMILSASFH